VRKERLDNLVRDGVGFDLETHLIQPGLVAPPIVCGSIATAETGALMGELVPRIEALAAFDTILGDQRRTIVGANIAYDVICVLVAQACIGIDVAPQVFAMYDPTRGAVRGDVDGRVFDVQVAEALHAVALGMLGVDPATNRRMTGRYSLLVVVQQVLGRDNAKANDRYRLSYALLEDTPIEQWPFEARTYPVDDAVNTLEAALAQAGHLDNVGPHRWVEAHCVQCGSEAGGVGPCRSRYRRHNAHEISRQTYVSLCMNLGAAWGFHVNQASVDALQARYDADHVGRDGPFLQAGILRPDGTENQGVLKGLVARAYGAVEPCATCARTGKVPSPVTNGKTKINCTACGGTGLMLPPSVPRTEKDGVGKGRDVLQESGDEFLMSYAEYTEGSKIPDVYIPFLRGVDKSGEAHPGVPLVLRPNPMLETGRTSYDGVIQLMPRSGGVRECIEARPGYVFSSEDYTGGELVTHAQSCLWIVGASKLADALNKGLNAHAALAGTILSMSYEDVTKAIKAGSKRESDTRQAAKPANFGFPGRMGGGKLVLQQRKGGPDTPHPSGPTLVDDGKGNKVPGYKGLRFCILMGKSDRCGDVKVTEWKNRPYPPTCKRCLECADQLRKDWLLQWPENVPYFEHVKKVDESGMPVVQHMSKRLRSFRKGQVDSDGEPINSGNAIANGYFQALLADAAKNALMAATRECYDRTTIVESHTNTRSSFEGGPSPLFGSRIIVFQHDELVCEHPESVAHEAATRVSEIMVEALRLACPDLAPACEAEPALMRKLYKGAKKVVDASGRLQPWAPK
jgi:hypothetical protein